MAAPEALLILLPLIALGAAFLLATCDDEFNTATTPERGGEGV